jgi:hypothetical protein
MIVSTSPDRPHQVVPVGGHGPSDHTDSGPAEPIHAGSYPAVPKASSTALHARVPPRRVRVLGDGGARSPAARSMAAWWPVASLMFSHQCPHRQVQPIDTAMPEVRECSLSNFAV